ncbi:MAG: Asp-tRNA(Asn)/Glu-tRNA(Gln) amidotransferase subunit GatA [Candidatus Harrisonbacteria bacterium]|nr:Asp-tRNA(Asn)/Glu-tRNA(Gln) amidotransferase subunit GatA [Candidatus Harrisonbacteria bacterium]
MVPLPKLTLKKFHDGLINREFKAREVVESYFKEIDKHDDKIGAYLSLDKEAALLSADEADLRIKRGERLDLLSAAPLAIKDNILVKNTPTTAASKVLEGYKASYDAAVIKKLRSEGAIFLGKTNLDEFACGSTTESSAYKKTRNPHNTSLVPGGSSGGSAAAVAANLCLAALGSDTGGSIRQPAAFCEVVGLKPTYGAVSRSGLIALGSSLDCIGPLTKTVEDAGILFKSIAGVDSKDSTSRETFYGDDLYRPKLERVKELVVGLPAEFAGADIHPDIQSQMTEVVKNIKSLGIRTKSISLPHVKYAISCYYIIMPAELSANLSRFDGLRYAPLLDDDVKNLLDCYEKNRSLGFGKEIKRRLILGAFVLSSGYYDAYYEKAQKVRSLIADDFARAYEEVDVILTPTSPIPPFPLGKKVEDPMELYFADIMTIPANLVGLPAISIPPGFQLIGRHFKEADILGLGYYYERLSNN